MLDITITSKTIKKARKKAELTQEQLADMLFVTKQAVSNWERGENIPDEDVRERLEKILGIKLRKESMNTIHRTPFLKHIPELKPLEEISSVEEISSAVEAIVNPIDVEAFEQTVKKMLYLTLVEVLGYEIYFEDHCRKYYSDSPLDWASTASDLRSIISDMDDWPINRSTYPFRTKNVISNKIEIMAYNIGGELFEDFDEDGYRNDFAQQIGRYGQDCGYTLLSLLPETNTDIMVVYKTAILDIIDILSEVGNIE